jgi:hypothetical protein
MLLSVFQADLQPTSVAWPLQPIAVHPVAKLGQVHLRQRAQDERCVPQLYPVVAQRCASFIFRRCIVCCCIQANACGRQGIRVNRDRADELWASGSAVASARIRICCSAADAASGCPSSWCVQLCCSCINSIQAIRARAQADHSRFDLQSSSSSVSPIVPLVLQQPSLEPDSCAQASSAHSSMNLTSSHSPAAHLYTPASSAAATPDAVDTVYRLHRVSPYRYVDTPLSSRCHDACSLRCLIVSLMRLISLAPGPGSVPEAGQTGRLPLEARHLGDTFEDAAVGPIELNFVAPSSSTLSPEPSPATIGALEPAIFSFSTSVSNSAAHSSNLSLRHVVDDAVNNLVMQARARRRVQAERMRSKLRTRALRFILLEWQRAAAATSGAAQLYSVKMELVAQR